MKKEIINTAIEMTKNIPSTDNNVSENNFDDGITCFNGDVLTFKMYQEDNNLTPYPKIEFDVVVEPTVDKFKNKINSMSQNGRQAEGGMNVIQTVSGVRFYQLMCRWNVDSEPESEMPSKNSEAGHQGPEPLHMSGLENEPDLYEDVEKDVDKAKGSAVEG